MHLIYAKGRCQVHLGDCLRNPFSTWDDRVAVKALNILAKRSISKMPGSSDWDTDTDTDARVISLSEEEDEYVEESLGHICQSLDKPRFSRMWIVQEYVIGSKLGNACFWGE
jgi:hypothetical protein